MTIHLPPHIESSIQAAVRGGRFASLDEAMTEAATLLVQRLHQEQAQARPSSDPLLGAWREDADLLDEIVEHAMKVREERPWRLAPGE